MDASRHIQPKKTGVQSTDLILNMGLIFFKFGVKINFLGGENHFFGREIQYFGGENQYFGPKTQSLLGEN